MELRHLRYFVAVAEELNFSRAARRLHIAQPPLSAQIRTLEGELGFSLFERSSQGVRLSVQGRAFLPRARVVLASAAEAADAAKLIASGRAGRLRVGLVPPALTAGLAAAFNGFRAANPGVELRVELAGARRLREQLVARELDVTFTRETFPAPAGLGVRVLEKHATLLALPAEHPLAARERIRWRELGGATVLLLHANAVPGYGEDFLERCERAGAAVRVERVAADLQALIWLVSSGFGVCPYPASLVASAPSTVAFRPLSPALPPLELRMEWWVRSEDPLTRGFTEAFRAVAQASG